MPHTIRIIGPWNARFIQDGTEHVEVFRVPGELTFVENQTEIRLVRAFNCPTGLDSNSKVGIEIEGELGKGFSLNLNGHPLDSPSENERRFPVQHLLESSNQLTIRIGANDRESIRLDLVQLVIDESD